MTPLLSVVVPVRNGAPYLRDLFAALDAQTLAPERYEVVVVDNNSDDATPALLRLWESQAPNRRVLQATGTGPAHARNVGAAAARGEWIAFTDADTEPEPEWLETLARVAQANGAVALEGAVVAWPAEAVGPYTHQISNENGGKFVTANMAYRRELFERLGGFDESFEQAFLEDSDLAFRALDAGVEIPFVADARVRHRVIAMSSRATLRSARRVRWLPLFARKHPYRYREQLRTHVRALSPVDARVVAGVTAAALLPATRGVVRLALAAVALDGVRVGVGRGRSTGSVLLSFALPLGQAFWWVEGQLRHGRR